MKPIESGKAPAKPKKAPAKKPRTFYRAERTETPTTSNIRYVRQPFPRRTAKKP